MRQGNGTDLLGANDPRAASIGIIYVAPNDDRTSVLAAILTQEKLGRKQVAVVLPNPNKAFQRPVDFDDLKAVRRKLQVDVIFIATPGPGPAEFARQRRFPVYSTLESYAEALREQDTSLLASGGGSAAGGEKKSFWPFGRQKNNVSSAPPAGVPLPEEDEDIYDEEPEQHMTASPPQRRSHAYADEELLFDDPDERDAPPPRSGGAGAVATGAAAGFLLGDELANHPLVPENHVAPAPGEVTPQAMNVGGATQAFNLDEDEDALPPPSAGVIPIRAGTSVPEPPQQAIPGRQTRIDPPAEDDEVVEEPPHASAAPAADVPIILGQTKKPRNTAQLPPDPQPVSARRRNNMAVPSAGPAIVNTPQPTGVSSMHTPPAPPFAPGGTPSGGRGGNGARRPGRVLLGVALLLLLTLLVCTSLAYAQPQLLRGLIPGLRLPGASGPSATITIMPASQVVSNNYVITGVAGTPDPKQQTIKARSLTSSAQSQPLPVKASGHNQTTGKAATGVLTFYNLNTTATTIKAHTVLTTGNGVQLWNNTAVTIPAAVNFPTASSQDVNATVLSIGTGGNIAPGSISGSCCTGGVVVKNNSAFIGGQDPANYNFITQSDVNAAATQQVQNQIAQQAVNQLNGKLAKGELLAEQPQCQTSIVNSTPIGDHGQGYNSSTVTVSTSCNSVAYDDQGMRALVTQLLTQKAQISPGAGYILQDNRIIIDPKIQSANPVSLNVNAKGQWVYQFGDQQKTALANLIKGRSVSAATAILHSTKGIASATIQFDGTTLPTDPNQISFVIGSPTALSGGGTTPGASPTVTIAGTPGASSATPSVGVGRG